MRLGEVAAEEGAEDSSALVLQTYSCCSSCLQEGVIVPSHRVQTWVVKHTKFNTAYYMLRSHLAASTALSTPSGFLALLV